MTTVPTAADAAAAPLPDILQIRDCTDADLSAVRSILNHEIEFSTASWTTARRSAGAMEDWLSVRRAGGFPVLVACAGQEVRGFASCGPFRRGEGYAPSVEHSVYVGAAHRGRGVARALMELLIARARSAGFRLMIGGVSGDSAASLSFHRALGFREVGRIPRAGEKFGRRLDLVLMARDLESAS